MSKRLIVAALLALLLVMPRAARANINVKWCAEFQASFEDTDQFCPQFFDDYYCETGDQDRVGFGALVKVVNNGLTVSNAFTDEGTGCTGWVSIDPAQLTMVTIYSVARVGTNTMYVYQAPAISPALPAVSASSGTYPPSTLTNNSTHYQHTTTAAAYDWAAIAAVTWAMHRRTAGLTNENFVFYTDDCPGAQVGPCFDPASDATYLGATNDEKHLIVHEFGHAIAYEVAGDVLPDLDYTWDNTHLGCQNDSASTLWRADSDEYQAAAFFEGFADFYSAVAFNNTSDSDCFRYGAGIDWDDDQDNENVWYSCAGAEPEGISAQDFWWNGSDGPGNATLTCKNTGVSVYNMGTPQDWTRFLWDLDTTQAMAFNDIYDIWAASSPEWWYENGDPVGFSGGYPSYELHQAAISLGFQAEWEAEWDNGPLR